MSFALLWSFSSSLSSSSDTNADSVLPLAWHLWEGHGDRCPCEESGELWGCSPLCTSLLGHGFVVHHQARLISAKVPCLAGCWVKKATIFFEIEMALNLSSTNKSAFENVFIENIYET